MNIKYKASVIDLIKARTSWRKYSDQEIPKPIKQDILAQIAADQHGPFGNQARLQWLEKDIYEKAERVKLGTYGFIAGARNFIVGAVKVDQDKNFEDYGYLLEKLILYLTDLGLGTCWVGGTFKRSEFAKTIALQDDEIIPAITPIGYPSAKRGFKDRLIRGIAGSKNRKPWSELFFLENFSFPLSPGLPGPYTSPLEMLRLAPSASNLQPWRILQYGKQFHFLLKRTPNYGKKLKSADLQRIDMGIAMCHFELTARELNLDGRWQVLKNSIHLPGAVEYVVSWICDK